MKNLKTVLMFSVLTLSLSNVASAGNCTSIVKGFGSFGGSVSSAASMALNRIDRLKSNPKPSLYSWRELAFSLGALTQAKMALNTYVESCTNAESEGVADLTSALEAALQTMPESGDRFDATQAHQGAALFAQLNARELGGFTGEVPAETAAPLSDAQLRTLRTAVERNMIVGSNIRSYMRAPTPESIRQVGTTSVILLGETQ